MRIHFIAIGGSIMHQLAICLANEGHIVSGSDDMIFEPALSNLRTYGLLPENLGFSAQNVKQADLIILGMHAKKDNPEYVYALEKQIPLLSFPEYVYSRTKGKTRIVIAGSHGKTTTTAMLAHMLKSQGKGKFDLLVGAQIPGFASSVQLFSDSKLAIFEGDEYPASIANPIPKFLYYKPHIAVITGIAWDHINVFPSFEIYKQQFSKFIQSIVPDGKLIYNSRDEHLCELVQISKRQDLQLIPYSLPSFHIDKNSGTTYVNNSEPVPLKVFGEHNLANLVAATAVIQNLGYNPAEFVKTMTDFVGAKNRMECVLNNADLKIYRDFAHSPSKVQAAIQAFCGQFSAQNLFLCLELHTYSSLNEVFLTNYLPILEQYPQLFIYCSSTELARKKSSLSIQKLGQILNLNPERIIDNPQKLSELILALPAKSVALLMSSGNFDALDLRQFGK